MKMNKKTTMFLVITLLVLVTSCAQNSKRVTTPFDSVTGLVPLEYNPPDKDNYIETDNFFIKKGTPADANTGQVNIKETTTGGKSFILGRTANYAFVQSHNGEPLAINPLGNNVGIGTIVPQAKLHVNGAVKLEGLQGSGKFLCIDSSNIVYRSETLCNYGITVTTTISSATTSVGVRDTLKIDWTSVGLTSTDKVKIEYYDAANNLRPIIADQPISGSYTWSVPGNIVLTTPQIRILVSSGSLKEQSSWITLSSPNPTPAPEPTPEPQQGQPGGPGCSTDPEMIERGICW